MKKILNPFAVSYAKVALISLFLSSVSVYSQINIEQNFDPFSSLPSGWTTSSSNGFIVTASSACEGKSTRDLVYDAASAAFLSSPDQTNSSNGTDIAVSFSYKIINQSNGGATPASFGNIQVQYSLNNGSTWNTAFTINNSNHTPSTSCATKSFTIAGANAPNGSSFKLRFQNTWSTGAYYILIDDVSAVQNPGTVPDCNAALTSPLNGSTNVAVSLNQITWGSATGIPTGYKVSVGTTPGGTQIADNIDAGNTNTYPFTFHYQTTYYVKIIPYNGSGEATGCTEQSFTTQVPVTQHLPWEEDFAGTSAPAGWTRNTFVIGSTVRLPDADSNIIYKNFRSTITTENFSTVSVGEIESGNHLSFNYRFANYDAPYGAPSSGAGNFAVALSTDYGITYNNIQTVVSDGTAGWKTFDLDLSPYAGNYVKIKITGNWISGNWVVGFDDFYTGEEITCATPENLNLSFTGNDSARIEWESTSNSQQYIWYVFESGANPQIDEPVQSGNTNVEIIDLYNLQASTEYDFYVQADCGETDGESQLSEALSFTTLCSAITDFPFTETFETSSTSLECWYNETVSGNTLWGLGSGAGGSVNSAHTGTQNALFTYSSPSANVTKLISPALDVSHLISPALTFWYANQENNGGQNELRVYYKSSPAGSWTLIPGAVYNGNVNQWTQIQLVLPEASDEYYIAFEGKNDWGYGIALDDVTVLDGFSCPDSTTWNGLTWSNGLPDTDKKAVINGNLVLNQNLDACQLEISENGNLEIPDGFRFTVQASVINHATAADLVVASGANLIQIENNAENEGAITVKRNSQPFKRLDYTLWSSPVSGMQIGSFSPQTLPNRIFTYEGESGYVVVPSVTENLSAGEGYLFRAPNNWNATSPVSYEGIFTGVPVNGSITVATHPESYTSIGNPYPSNVDADLLMGSNEGISALYFWVNTPLESGEYVGNNYASYNSLGGTSNTGSSIPGAEGVPNGVISAGQGFIVETTDGSVSFDNTMRTGNDGEFFKVDEIERHRYWLNFSTQSGGELNQILIGYMTGATNGYDHQIDGKLFGYSGSALYSVIDNDKFVIQGRAVPFDEYDVVPLGIRIITAGSFKIKIAARDGLFSEGQSIFLHDKYLDTIFEITSNTYEFSSQAGEFNDRFDIIYIDPGSDCPDLTNWNGVAWSNGLPDENKKVIINGDFTLNSDLEACELEVTGNGSLTIPDGFNFTVNGIIVNHAATGDFIVSNNANLIQTENVNNMGSITVQRNSQNMIRLDYTLWASPVTDQNLFGFSPNTVNGVTNYNGSAGRIYIYDGPNGYVNPDPFTADAVFENGTGYLFRSPNNWSATEPAPYSGTFTGVPFNGNLSVDTHAGNYTSVGNPYPSNLDAYSFMVANPGVSTLYFWVNTSLNEGSYTGNNYASFNLTGGTSNTGSTLPGAEGVPTGIISVGQGFIVGSSAASVSFDNTMRTSSPGEFFKTDELERHRFWLNLSDKNNNGLNQILIGYMTGATEGIDDQIDGELFGYEGSALYSIIGEQNFTIQGRALPFENSDVVPVGFRAVEDGIFNISLASVDGLFSEGQKIYLKDHLLNTVHDLTVSPYEFESVAGEFKNRFEIIYQEEGTMATDELTANGILIYRNAGKIEILSKEYMIVSVEVFDMSGRKLFVKQEVHSNLYQMNSDSFGRQVVIVRVRTDDGKIISKKFIN